MMRSGSRSSVPLAEFERRWTQVQEFLRTEGFAACVVWGRGASALDGYSDLLWMSNHYPWTPTVRLDPPTFMGSGHAAVVIGAQSAPTLVCDAEDYRRDHVQIDDVRISLDVAATVAHIIRGLAGSGDRVAMVAGHGPIASLYQRMLDEAPSIDWVAVDNEFEHLRLSKSEWELQAIRESCRLGQESLEAILDIASTPGATEAEAVAAGYSVVVRNGGQPLDAFVSSGPFSKYHAYGRLPSWTIRTLERGDFFTIDWSGVLDGYWFDCGRTVVVGSRPSADQLHVLDTASAAMERAQTLLKAGTPAGDIFHAVRQELAARGVQTSATNGCSGELAQPPLLAAGYHGHGTGLFWEGPWAVAGEPRALTEATSYNVELVAGSDETGWAKLEEQFLVTGGAPQRLMTTPWVAL